MRVQKEKCLTYRKHLPGSTYGIATKSHRWWGYFPRQSYIESVLTNLSQIQFWIFILKGLPISPFISYRIVLSSVPYHNDSSVTFRFKVIALLLLLFFAQPLLWWSITIFPCNRQPPHHTVQQCINISPFFFNIIFCHHHTNNESAHHYHGKKHFHMIFDIDMFTTISLWSTSSCYMFKFCWRKHDFFRQTCRTSTS